eukprot:c16420_g1_i1.p2 GENE.c16420_g1_i1~~c16420_g1_i1.p2  ORF type:complete len:115 (+),score=28.06 c16420_g1_i1:24-347(+)
MGNMCSGSSSVRDPNPKINNASDSGKGKEESKLLSGSEGTAGQYGTSTQEQNNNDDTFQEPKPVTTKTSTRKNVPIVRNDDDDEPVQTTNQEYLRLAALRAANKEKK